LGHIQSLFHKASWAAKKKLKWAPYGSLAATHIPGVDKLFAKHARKDNDKMRKMSQCGWNNVRI
jgi:hypothetical protein